MDLDKSTWQKIMNDAFAKCQDGMAFVDFLALLHGKEKHAVLLGTLNYQVENGGIMQWFDNGYGAHIEDVLDTLRCVGTPRTLELYEKLDGFRVEYGNIQRTNSDDDDLCVGSESFDRFYYSNPFRDEYLQDVEDFLRR